MIQNPLFAQFANKPVMVSEDSRDEIMANLNAVMQMPHAQEILAETASNEDNFWPEPDSWKAALRPYNVKDGTLQIPVKGVLLHEMPWQLFNWATGYEYIWRAFERGMNDDDVDRIAFVVNSPGGHVAGCAEAVDKMNALKAEIGKPVQAFAHEYAYSAAYHVIMPSDKITVSRTGGVGSIGVLTSHLDVSGNMEQRGYKMTFIHSGKHKVDGNAYEPLPDDVRARIQQRLDELYSIFVSAVAQGRNMDEQEVRDTEALTFTATQSLSNGLADAIGTLDDALAAFAADLSNPKGNDVMPPENKGNSAETATADIASARAEGVAEGSADAATQAAAAVQAERERISAITTSDEAEGRQPLANYFAMKTDMSVEDAKAALAESPKTEAATPVGAEPTAEEAAAAETPFNTAMNGGKNPEVGAESGNNGGDAADEDDSGEVVALAQKLGLPGFGAATPAAAA